MVDSIAVKVFNKFYAEYRDASDTKTAIFNLLPPFVKEAAADHGCECSLGPALSMKDIDGSTPFFEVDTYFSNSERKVIITENGNIYQMDCRTYKTEGVTWNGDDEFFDNFAVEYSAQREHGCIKSIANLVEGDNLTAEKMKNMACEIVSAVFANETK